MNKQDVDKVYNQVDQAIRYFSPMAHALNHAADVFAALSNAIPHKEALTREVEALKTELESIVSQAQDQKDVIQQQDKLVAQAKADAAKKIEDTVADADAQVVEILASIKEKTKSAYVGLAAKEAEVAMSLDAMQKAYDSAVAEMQAREQALLDKEQALTSTISALETKLDALKKQAQKFAAVFTAE
jgi:chromosome segregation ATPase